MVSAQNKSGRKNQRNALPTSKDHTDYKIIVNKITELARQIQHVPPSTIALLDRLIPERTEYSYWLSGKSTDAISEYINESHAYYIQVLEEVRTMLAKRMELEAKTAPRINPPAPATTPSMSTQTNKVTLGKGKNSFTTLQGPDQSKAVKTEITKSKSEHVLVNQTEPSVTAQNKQQEKWRQVIAETCDKTNEKTCATTARPMSYAAALRVPITA